MKITSEAHRDTNMVGTRDNRRLGRTDEEGAGRNKPIQIISMGLSGSASMMNAGGAVPLARKIAWGHVPVATHEPWDDS